MQCGNWPWCIDKVLAPIPVGAVNVDCLSILLSWMSIEDTIVREEFFLLFGRQILVSKENDAPLQISG